MDKKFEDPDATIERVATIARLLVGEGHHPAANLLCAIADKEPLDDIECPAPEAAMCAGVLWTAAIKAFAIGEDRAAVWYRMLARQAEDERQRRTPSDPMMN